MVLRKSFYIRWSAGRSPRVHEVNPGRDPSQCLLETGQNPVSYALKDFLKSKHTQINRISQTKQNIFNMAC